MAHMPAAVVQHAGDYPVAITSLAISFSDWNVHDPAPEADPRSDFIMRGCHIVTPSMRGHTHYFWAAAFYVPRISDEVAADPKGLDFPEVTLGADGAGIKVRQILNRKPAVENHAL